MMIGRFWQVVPPFQIWAGRPLNRALAMVSLVGLDAGANVPPGPGRWMRELARPLETSIGLGQCLAKNTVLGWCTDCFRHFMAC